jgi:hypothetical protein
MNENDILALLNEHESPAPKHHLASGSAAFYMKQGAIAKEQETLLHTLKSKGIGAMNVALEIEIVLNEDPMPGTPRDATGKRHWERRKQDFLNAVDERIKNAKDKPEADSLNEQRAIISRFNARETLFHDLIHDKEVVPLIHPVPLRYYPDKQALSYYDNKDVFELRMIPLDARQTAAIHRTLIHRLESLMAEYNISRANEFVYHYNVSFEKDGKNVLDPKHPAYTTTGKALLQGIAQVKSEAAAMFYKPDTLLLSRLPNVSMGPARKMALRLAGSGQEARLEIPLEADDQLHDFGLINMVLAAGALHGISNPPPVNTYEQVEMKRRGFFKTPSYDAWYVTHVLNGMTIEPGGNITLFEPYTRDNVNILAPILGLPPIKGTGKRETFAKKQQEETVVEFFKHVRITEEHGKPKVHWPKNSGVSPDIIRWLEAQIEGVDMVPVLSLQPGLVTVAISPTPSERRGEYIARLEQSQVLNTQLTPDTMQDLVESLSALHEKPSTLAAANARRVLAAPARSASAMTHVAEHTTSPLPGG